VDVRGVDGGECVRVSIAVDASALVCVCVCVCVWVCACVCVCGGGLLSQARYFLDLRVHSHAVTLHRSYHVLRLLRICFLSRRCPRAATLGTSTVSLIGSVRTHSLAASTLVESWTATTRALQRSGSTSTRSSFIGACSEIYHLVSKKQNLWFFYAH
jgi:hypothetical protein